MGCTGSAAEGMECPRSSGNGKGNALAVPRLPRCGCRWPFPGVPLSHHCRQIGKPTLSFDTPVTPRGYCPGHSRARAHGLRHEEAPAVQGAEFCRQRPTGPQGLETSRAYPPDDAIVVPELTAPGAVLRIRWWWGCRGGGAAIPAGRPLPLQPATSDKVTALPTKSVPCTSGRSGPGYHPVV